MVLDRDFNATLIHSDKNKGLGFNSVNLEFVDLASTEHLWHPTPIRDQLTWTD